MTVRKFPRLAFVDLETTGGTANEDRITEVGIIEVDDDGVREWSSLVNPGMKIPPFIQSLTGISDAMVENAPTFEQIAGEVAARLADRVFIAHNARFDYGFLRNEFRRAGHDFRPPVLCTVRLSRKLFPGFARHNLDTLAERHQLHVTERHRALGDAQLIWQFWQRIHEEHAAETIDEVVAKLISQPAIPVRLDALQIENMPESHGVYLFYGEHDLPLYIGRGSNLRRRVLSHFSGDNASSKEQRLNQQIERVDWVETSGELGALLQEAALTKALRPAYQQRLRGDEEVCSWRLTMRKGRLVPMLTGTDDLFFGIDSNMFGLYGSARKANDALRAIADANGLCHVLLGLEKSRNGKPCGGAQVGKCAGACTGKESIEAHNIRLLAALESARLQPWPFNGPIAIRENTTFHIIDCWSYLGAARTGEETEKLLQKGRPPFDRDVYQIVRKWLKKPDVQVVDL